MALYEFADQHFDYVRWVPDVAEDYFECFEESDHYNLTGNGTVNDSLWEYMQLNNIPVRPARPPYTMWDFINEEWVNDPVEFNPALFDAIKEHRKTKVMTEITFNGVTAYNSADERNLIVGILQFLNAFGEEYAIQWKQPDDTFVTAYMSDFMGLMRDGGIVTQYGFTAESQVRAAHEVTPYASIEAALEDFDEIFDNLMGVS